MAEWVLVGQICGLYGLQGWVKVFSYTQKRESILDYDPLYINCQGGWRSVAMEQGRSQGKGIVIKFAGFDDRTTATSLLGCPLAVQRQQLPPLETGEYYWADLEGLRVIDLAGRVLGEVRYLFETGANDVMVVVGEREHLIPFVQPDVIIAVDITKGFVQVDWDTDF